MGCDDPLEAVLSAADECGIKFFVSNDFWGDLDAYNMMLDKGVQTVRFQAMEEIAERYSHHAWFLWVVVFLMSHGWIPSFCDFVIPYVNECAQVAKSLNANCVNINCSIQYKERKM